MRKGTQKMFPREWNRFVGMMFDAAEQDALPLAFQVDDINLFSFKDIEDTFNDFKETTGLDVTGHMFLCPDCGKLHLMIEVDYDEEDEDTLIQ